MSARAKLRPLAGAAALLAAWSALQLWLASRVASAFNADNVRSYHQFLALRVAHPQLSPPHLYVVHDNFWIRAGAESAAAALLLTAVAAFLVTGGRRRGALLVFAMPLANVFGGFNEGAPLGIGWNQVSGSRRDWLILGTAVDSLLVLAVVVLLIRALPVSVPTMPASVAWARALPPLVVLVGWWLTQDMETDPFNRVWLAQAITFVVVAALLAGSALPLAARSLAVLGVLPLLNFTLLDDLFGSGGLHFDTMTFVHHAAYAAATGLYVAGVPVLLRRFPSLNRQIGRPARSAAS